MGHRGITGKCNPDLCPEQRANKVCHFLPQLHVIIDPIVYLKFSFLENKNQRKMIEVIIFFEIYPYIIALKS